MTQITLLDLQKKSLTATETELVGQIGERLAADFLVRRGLRVVCSNFKVPIGRNRRGAVVTGEIDIVALDGETLCFVEVKTRRSDEFASPLTAIDRRKQRQIIRTARVYRKIFNVRSMKYRFDAMSVILEDAKAPKIELFKGFWKEKHSTFENNYST